MKWSVRLGEFAGIGVYLHATFLLLIGFVFVAHWLQGQSLDTAVAGLSFTLALFGCVLLHEFGHALSARRFGIRTRDITLLPIGGVARLERMPEQPAHEMVVALAGPAVNVVVAGLLYAWLLLNAGLEPLSSLSVTGGSFVERLMVVNLFLVGFNLIPAFPMDGGRVLRALLALRLEYARATQIAATVGQGIALLLGFAGLFGNPMLLFIALFVWIGAAQEASTAQMKAALGGIPVSGAMVTEFRTLTPGDSLAQAVELVLRGSQQDFPVVDGERVVGVLTRADLLRVLTEHGQSASVGATMQRDFQVVDAADMLETAFGQLQTCECHTLPVVQRGRLVGLVTTENVGEFLMIQAARKTRSHQAV